jgi:hypothetical protein
MFDRLIADALQFRGDTHRRDGQAQVGGHGLAQGQQFKGLLFNGQFHAVERDVIDNHLPGPIRVPVRNRVHALAHRRLGQCRHAEQILLQISQLAVEMSRYFHGRGHYRPLS